MRSAFLVGTGDLFGRVSAAMISLGAYEYAKPHIRGLQFPRGMGPTILIEESTFLEASASSSPTATASVLATVGASTGDQVASLYLECRDLGFVSSTLARASSAGASPLWLWDDNDVLWPADQIDAGKLFMG